MWDPTAKYISVPAIADASRFSGVEHLGTGPANVRAPRADGSLGALIESLATYFASGRPGRCEGEGEGYPWSIGRDRPSAVRCGDEPRKPLPYGPVMFAKQSDL